MDQGVIVLAPGASGKAGAADAASHSPPKRVFFSRRELDMILGLYGRMVAAGEWRDYAMADGVEVAVFAVHRRTSEQPLYRIEKRPALARKQGAYSVIAAGGRVMKRGADLANVLAVLERKLLKIVEGE
ncbi:DUF2794 domain-containing protein [Zavarzinia aquatilis]|uniref:DUF2794 domain-containing protein n=1 Tax=Zavarzinia aquatilis TaxID=2211142 RepID=A0A317E021_9PROT|nr:DUF2794 domain-containing protein [Zavarzinia aquatilis]PWR20329.1 DUF2794 domain-containing protein [Zavarzinia aquatilis]